jgi:hypothetical protein
MISRLGFGARGGAHVRAGVAGAFLGAIFGVASLSSSFLLSATVLCVGQTLPPLPSFLSPYEITRIARTAGFDPLAPPLREGTTYVLRATDPSGSLMRVVVDARSGAIRTVNPIATGPGSFDQVGMLPPAGGSASYGTPDHPYSEIAPQDERAISSSGTPVAVRPLIGEPPLPRPRPSGLVTRDAKFAAHAKAAAARKPVLVQVPD